MTALNLIQLRAEFDAWASDNLPQYFSGKAATWADVEANAKAAAWAAWQDRAALAQSPVSAEGLTDANRIDHIERKGVLGGSYKGVGSIDTIIRVDDYEVGGLRWAIDCMIERERAAIAATDKGAR